MTSNDPVGISTIPRELRVAPKQARARETVRHILDTAALLLEEVGVDAFNTNLLAERAGVRVRTVYRYFPNKTAVILALAEQSFAEWDAWAESELAHVGKDGDWRAAMEASTRELIRLVRELPGQAAIRRAMRAIPELYALDQQDNERLAEMYARAIRRVAPDLPLARARRVARCLIESSAAILDLSIDQTPAASRKLIDELVAMQLAYLESVISRA